MSNISCDKCGGNVVRSDKHEDLYVCENCHAEYSLAWVRMKCRVPITYLIKESSEHEGTWLIWPHEYHFANTKPEGKKSLDKIEWIWLKIIQSLCSGEKIHIIAYDKSTEKRIRNLLTEYEIALDNIDFVIAKTDSFWVRDIGPIFGMDNYGKTVILNFEFDSWGKKIDEGELLYENDNHLPAEIAKSKDLPLLNIPDFSDKKLVLEGGSYDYDGYGTLMSCKSSVVSEHRNPNFTTEEVELYFQQYFGIESCNIIWLNGKLDRIDSNGNHSDITDCHVDGIARFFDENTIVSLPKEYLPEGDYDKLVNAQNGDCQNYQIVELPIDNEDEWVYINYYIGNEALIVPTLSFVNTKILNILSELYPLKKIVPIDVTELVKYGGAVHCITQQQPKTPPNIE